MTEEQSPEPAPKRARISATKAEQLFIRELYDRNFFACLFNGFKKIADYSVPTLQVVLDPKSMRHVALVYNPNFLAEQFDEKDGPHLFRFFLAHEGAHVVLRHIPRWLSQFKTRRPSEHDRNLMNIAADLAANCLCLNCVLPKGGRSSKADRQWYIDQFRENHLADAVFPDKFDFDWGLTFEQYYELLKQKFPPQGGQGQDSLKIAVIDPQGEGQGDAEGMSLDEIEDQFDLVIVKRPSKKKGQQAGGEGDEEGDQDGESDEEGDQDGEGDEEGDQDGEGQGQKGEPGDKTSENKAKTFDKEKDKEEDIKEQASDKPIGESLNPKQLKIPVIEEHQWMRDDALEVDEEDLTKDNFGRDEEERDGSPAPHEGDMFFPAVPELDPNALDSLLQSYVEQAMDKFERSNGRGTLPGNLRSLIPRIKQVKAVRIPWETFLKRIISRAVPMEDEEIFSLQNPRLLHLQPQGVLPFPSYFQVTGMKAAFIRDTSGSMGAPELKEVVATTLSFFKAYPDSELWFVDADTVVHRPVLLKDPSDMPPDRVGGGGTDFIRPIAYVEEHLKPDIIFYGTDGYGSAPRERPKTPIVWCMTLHSHIPAPYGAVLQMSSRQVIRHR